MRFSATNAVNPLGLRRLGNEVKPDRFEVVALDPGTAKGRNVRRNAIECLELEAGAVWTCKVRGSGATVSFVTFIIDASVSSTLNFAGARLQIASAVETGRAKLLLGIAGEKKGIEWQDAHYTVPLEQFDGRTLGQLPVLTVRVDAKAREWDVFSASTPIATGLALPANASDANQLTIAVGEEGAVVTSIVFSEENPLFADTNVNGVPDDFEAQALGGVSPSLPNASARAKLLEQWQRVFAVMPPPTIQAARPVPDRILAVMKESAQR